MRPVCGRCPDGTSKARPRAGGIARGWVAAAVARRTYGGSAWDAAEAIRPTADVDKVSRSTVSCHFAGEFTRGLSNLDCVALAARNRTLMSSCSVVRVNGPSVVTCQASPISTEPSTGSHVERSLG